MEYKCAESGTLSLRIIKDTLAMIKKHQRLYTKTIFALLPLILIGMSCPFNYAKREHGNNLVLAIEKKEFDVHVLAAEESAQEPVPKGIKEKEEKKSRKYGLVLDDTYIRTGPGAEYPILMKAREDEEFEYICFDNEEHCAFKTEKKKGPDSYETIYEYWYKIIVDGTEKWINASYFFRGALVNSKGNSLFIGQEEILKKQEYLKQFEHGDYYSFVLSSEQESCDGYCDIVDMWLISKKWTERHHLLRQQSYHCGDVHWSKNNQYFLYVSDGTYVYDVKKRKVRKFVKSWINSPQWTSKNMLIHLDWSGNSTILKEYNPKTGKDIVLNKLVGFSTEPNNGKCYVDGVDPPCPLYSFFEVEHGIFFLHLFNDHDEIWKFGFDEHGKVISKKLFESCKGYK